MEDKKAIRKRMSLLREQLTPEEVRLRSMSIFRRLTAMKEFQEASKVFTYVSMKNEADTIMLIDYSLSLNKQVYVPRVEGKKIAFYEISDISELSPGYFGIYEPDIHGKEPDYSKRGLFIMPGLAFDKEHHRIGYGGGYYDRYLAEGGDFHTAALAYGFQIEDKIPFEEYDRKPEWIVTEDAVI